jgi:ATP-dependent Lhr-like helicase
MPYSGLDAATFGRVIEFVATGGYALKAYDKFRKLDVARRERQLAPIPPQIRRAAPLQRRHHRRCADARCALQKRAQSGPGRGIFRRSLRPGDSFIFAGMALEVEAIRDLDLIVRAAKKAAHNPQLYGRADAADHASGRAVCAPS